MTHLALVGLLAGSLALTPPDGPGDDKKITDTDKPAVTAEATPGVFHTDKEAAQDAELRTPTVYTYAQGRPVAEAPFKIWAQYAYGTADEFWDTSGEEQALALGSEVVSQRIQTGAQINFLSFERFSLGAGAILNVAKNEVNGPGFESTFGLQGVTVYGSARGRVVGIHAGYQFDLGEGPDDVDATAGETFNSDGFDAVLIGADFDYPSDRFRVFGGVDYIELQNSNNDWMNYTAGLGLRFGFVEIGGALQIVTRFDAPTLTEGQNLGLAGGIGSHAGTVVPYLRLSPPSLPASIYVKGATPDEYFEYGYGIGGANSVKPGLGITAGLSVGFN